MSQKAPIQALSHFLPEGAFDIVAPYFSQYKIKLTLTQERKSILGNYRNPIHSTDFHLISINGNLNPYSFLITLMHEIAHLIAYVHFKHTIAPHGPEWKSIFQRVLQPFFIKKIFPANIENALAQYYNNMKASTCGDPNLYKTLKQYDAPSNKVFVDSLASGEQFKTEKGDTYIVVEKRRTRYVCEHVLTGKKYLFPAIYEVEKVK